MRRPRSSACVDSWKALKDQKHEYSGRDINREGKRQESGIACKAHHLVGQDAVDAVVVQLDHPVEALDLVRPHRACRRRHHHQMSCHVMPSGYLLVCCRAPPTHPPTNPLEPINQAPPPPPTHTQRQARHAPFWMSLGCAVRRVTRAVLVAVFISAASSSCSPIDILTDPLLADLRPGFLAWKAWCGVCVR
jgi:hypothetical protein